MTKEVYRKCDIYDTGIGARVRFHNRSTHARCYIDENATFTLISRHMEMDKKL